VPVVVTGAAGAIGAAIVRALAEQGETVLAQDLRPPPAPYGNVATIEGDLRDPACLERLGTAVAGSGVEAVVAAHGTFTGSGPFWSQDPASIRQLVDINFAVIPPLFDVMLPGLRTSQGTFIAIASQAALRGEPGSSTYCASKWAVRAWAETTDRSLRAEGVRVLAICPGRTESPLLWNAFETLAKSEGISRAEYEDRCRNQIPARRFGTPDEIAAAVLYLLTADARPPILVINGGEVPW
jgi:3-hydroxybutyrate dehydrogenase